MGMFDYIRYEGKEYQTKDTPNQSLDTYKIEVDQESGHQFLWVEEYDLEWVDDPGMMFGGHFKQINNHWTHCNDFDGAIRFYRQDEEDKKKWIEYKVLFMNGKMIKIEKI